MELALETISMNDLYISVMTENSLFVAHYLTISNVIK